MRLNDEGTSPLFGPSRWTRLKCPLFALLLLKSLLFVFLIPPWQVPDEPSHAEYAFHFHEPGGDWQASIAASLKEFETWRYSEGAGSFPDGLFVSVIDLYPPLYYRLISFWLPASSLLGKLYILRLYSVVLQALLFAGCVGLAASLIRKPPAGAIGRRGDLTVLREFDGASLVGAIVLLLPQTCLLFSGVSPDLLACVIVTFVLAILSYFLNLFGTRHPIPPMQGLLCLILLAVLSVAAAMTKVNALVVLPVIVLAFLLLPLQFRSWRRFRNYIVVMVVLGAAVFLVLPVMQQFEQVELGTRVGGMAERALDPVGNLSKVSSGPIVRFVAILYVSFWYSYGWMVYKMGVAWYLLFGAVVAVGVIGWLLVPWRQVNRSGVFVCVVALIVSIWVTFIETGPRVLDGSLTQARFIFPNVGTIIGLLVVGWTVLFSRVLGRSSERTSEGGGQCKPAIALLTCFFLFVNVVVVFKYVIPTFYLR